MLESVCLNCGSRIAFMPLYGKGTVEWVHFLGTKKCQDGQTARPGEIATNDYNCDEDDD